MKLILIPFALVFAGFIYWLAAPAFTDKIVDEEPTVVVPVSQRPLDDINNTNNQAPDTVVIDTDGRTQVSGTQEIRLTTSEPRPSIQEEVPSQTPEVLSGNFRGSGSYRASGQVFLSGSDISLVNLDSTNVPDGRIYLSNSLSASDNFVDLGRLKGNQGNQNYRASSNVDLDDYKYILIWCRAFSSLVGYAEIR